MKKMKLSIKLVGGYLIVAGLAGLIGYIGISELRTISRSGVEMYEKNTRPLGLVGETALDNRGVRIALRDAIIDKFVQNKEINGYSETVSQLTTRIEKSLPEIETTLKTEEGKKEFEALRANVARFTPIAHKIVGLVKDDKKEEAMTLMRGEALVLAKAMDASFSKLLELNIGLAKKKSDDNTSIARTATTVTVSITVLGVVIASLLGLFLTRSIGGSVNRVAESLSGGADQVASASTQVSSASQSLAEGASEQAAAIEETSSSIEEMASMARQNADNATQANTLMGSINATIENADRSMSELTESMGEITKASEETGKIIKTIDEIAFQTNLLALNAAVEAARAGEAGAGFAVVADEVRNLAMRAAEAAKNTSGLIEGTVKRVRHGSETVSKTNEEFGKVTEGARKVKELVAEIAAASQEQAQGVDQINKAVAEMDKVVQRNAASAEESASASEEMNAQADQMKESVAELAALVRGEGNGNGLAPGAKPRSEIKGLSQKVLKASVSSSAVRLPEKHAVKAPAGPVRGREVRPEQVIPMGEDFRSF